MATGFIITKSGVFIIDGAAEMQALFQRMGVAIDSGEATAYLIEQGNREGI